MNDLRIKSFDFQAAVARAGLRPDGMPRAEGVGGVQGGFKAAMSTLDSLPRVPPSNMSRQAGSRPWAS